MCLHSATASCKEKSNNCIKDVRERKKKEQKKEKGGYEREMRENERAGEK